MCTPRTSARSANAWATPQPADWPPASLFGVPPSGGLQSPPCRLNARLPTTRAALRRKFARSSAFRRSSTPPPHCRLNARLQTTRAALRQNFARSSAFRRSSIFPRHRLNARFRTTRAALRQNFVRSSAFRRSSIPPLPPQRASPNDTRGPSPEIRSEFRLQAVFNFPPRRVHARNSQRPSQKFARSSAFRRSSIPPRYIPGSSQPLP